MPPEKNLKIDALKLHFGHFQSNTDEVDKFYNNNYIDWFQQS